MAQKTSATKPDYLRPERAKIIWLIAYRNKGYADARPAPSHEGSEAGEGTGKASAKPAGPKARPEPTERQGRAQRPAPVLVSAGFDQD